MPQKTLQNTEKRNNINSQKKNFPHLSNHNMHKIFYFLQLLHVFRLKSGVTFQNGFLCSSAYMSGFSPLLLNKQLFSTSSIIRTL